jgi:hypothetical protein
MTTPPTQPEKPSAPAEGDAINITRHWNCSLFRWHCPLCGDWSEKQNRHYYLGDRYSLLICDGCAEHPEQIPDRIRAGAASLREEAAALDELAKRRYVRNPSGDDHHSDYDSWMAENRRQAIEANAQSDEDFF